jgi:Cupin-like domain
MAAAYSGKPERVYIGGPEIRGRFYYDDSRTSLNYRVETKNLVEVFDAIKEDLVREEHPYYFIPSLFYAAGYPGLQAENNLILDEEAFGFSYLNVKIWTGTESITGAHFDLPNNIACCAVGRRRFTLFPPTQIHNLYPGPFSLTPGGQVTTMVDIRNPDFEAYPRFRDAQAASVVADLEPGDALYYPSMWWHEVESKDRFNAMVNYWWNSSPRYMADPMEVLMHGILGIRDRPENEKRAWRELFDYYVFGPADKPREHLPETTHGVLADLDEDLARRLRATLQHTLNR